MAVARTIALNQMPMRGVYKNTADSTLTLTRDDSGIIFVQTYTTSCTYTLPAVADGKGCFFWFFNANTTSQITIASPTADTLCTHDDATATSTICDAEAGAWAMVFGDGTYWYFMEGGGAGAWTDS